jgi:hypothetical protein
MTIFAVMKKAIIAVLTAAGLLFAAGVPVRVQAQQPHVQYFDKDGNPVEMPAEGGNHEEHDHGSHEGHDHEGHEDGHEGHDHSDESIRALFEGVSGVVYGRPDDMVVHSFTGVAPRFGLAVQKGMFAEAGVSLDFYRIGYTRASEYVTFGYRNLRPYVSGEILVSGKKTLGGGKAGVEFIMSTALLGMAFGADASYYSDGALDAITVTPRLMLSCVYVEVFYGYNIFVRNHLTRWIGHHRLGVSVTLNPRFWQRKKQIYQDYYDSYL